MNSKRVHIVTTTGKLIVVEADAITVDDKARVVLLAKDRVIVGVFPCENIQAAYVDEPSDSKPRS
mgnify:CR=1 FL=1